MARPHKVIDQKQFEALCAIQCTEKEITMVLNVSEKTLNAWCKRTYRQSFSQIFKHKRTLGKVSLRRAQWKSAIDNENITMQIWLGKQFLDQAEKPVQETTANTEISDEVEKLLSELEME